MWPARCGLRMCVLLLLGAWFTPNAWPAQAAQQAAPDPAATESDDTDRSAAQIPEAEQPFHDSAQAFVDAYAERDAEAIGRLFTEDAEFLDEFGERTVGRAAIVELFESVFRESPGALVNEIRIERVRFVAPNVAMEEGEVVATADASATPTTSRYIALHTLGDDGQWRMNSVKDFPAENADRSRRLQDLSWLLGDWVNEDEESVVHTSCGWSADGNYLLKEFVIQTFDGRTLNGVQRIGWDAGRERIRSWTFDSRGGFTSGDWVRSGSDWIVTLEGVTADGETVTGTAVHTPIDDELVMWHYRNLTIGGRFLGESQPVRLVRRPPPPGQ